MDNITIQMVIAGIAIVAGNGITLKWIKSDIAKAVKRSDNHRDNIRHLYTRTNDMMTKKEIAELVAAINAPLSSDINETKETMKIIAENVVNMTIAVARMDERMKTRPCDIIDN